MISIREKSDSLFQLIYEGYKNEPVDLLKLNDVIGEYNYISNLKESYQRTVADIHDLFRHKNPCEIKILEIGSYLGVVCIALSKLGFKMTAGDLETFMQNKNLQKKYITNGVNFKAMDLKDPIPFPDECFNCVIMCETLEHLNFNPVPVLQEISRILMPDGFLYLALPNICSLENRVKLATGKSIHNSISDFFAQLDPNCNFSVGIHWREYAKDELAELLNKTGFKFLKHTFFHPWDLSRLPIKFYLRGLWVRKNFFYIIKKIFPSLKSGQTVICQKQSEL